MDTTVATWNAVDRGEGSGGHQFQRTAGEQCQEADNYHGLRWARSNQLAAGSPS